MSRSPVFYYEYAGPNDPPPPEEEPTHDVPTFPGEDTPPGTETAILWFAGPGEHDSPKEGEGATHASRGQPREGMPWNMSGQCPHNDVDDDDLDPQVPHSPPDGKKGRIIFDENGVAG
jgi:hypothetical protein